MTSRENNPSLFEEITVIGNKSDKKAIYRRGTFPLAARLGLLVFIS